MPRVQRPDGIEIHWESRGEGPPVVLVSYWNVVPAVAEPLTAELSRDHRVMRYDDRGAGESTREGPYDLDTAADDLAAVIDDAADEAAVLVTTADGPHRAVRAASRHPDLVEAVVCVGGHRFREAPSRTPRRWPRQRPSWMLCSRWPLPITERPFAPSPRPRTRK